MRIVDEINKHGEIIMFVYKIINNINNKVYIGITSKAIDLRWRWHLRDCARGIKKKLYNAMRRHGVENFSISVLEEHTNCSKEFIKSKEEFYIKKFNSQKNGYNFSEKSSGVKTHTLATRKKMSLRAMGRVPSLKTKVKLSKSMQKHWEHCGQEKKMKYGLLARERNTGRRRTEEQKRAQAEKILGRKHSKKTIELMKRQRKGKLSSKFAEAITCPYCKIAGKGNTMFRWHFDNCKEK